MKELDLHRMIEKRMNADGYKPHEVKVEEGDCIFIELVWAGDDIGFFFNYIGICESPRYIPRKWRGVFELIDCAVNEYIYSLDF